MPEISQAAGQGNNLARKLGIISTNLECFINMRNKNNFLNFMATLMNEVIDVFLFSFTIIDLPDFVCDAAINFKIV